MAHSAQPWRTSATGLRLRARVTSKSARNSIDGVTQTPEGPAIRVRVRAVPDKGHANKAVETAVAQWLGLAKTRVSIAHGGQSRVKTIDIAGVAGELETLLAARIAALR